MKEQSLIKTWLMAMRPQTLMASAMPVVAGGVMSFSNQHFSIFVFLTILLCALFIQIGTNFANDYFDFIKGADNDLRDGFTRVTHAGLVSLRDMRLAFIISLGIATLLGGYLVYLGGAPILIIGILSLISALAYTAGPYPLAYNGLGDLFVFTFFGPVAVGGTYYLLSGEFDLLSLIVGCSFGCIIDGILVVNNLRDVDGDRVVNKNTLVVKLGKRFARFFYAFLMTIGAVAPIFYVIIKTGKYPLVLVFLYLLFVAPLIKNIFKENDGRGMNKILIKTGISVIIFTLCFSCGWLIN